jgi:uncharacterized membrane protein
MQEDLNMKNIVTIIRLTVDCVFTIIMGLLALAITLPALAAQSLFQIAVALILIGVMVLCASNARKEAMKLS